MKKKNIIISVLLVIILVSLIIFASTYKYKDSYLRVEGIRVRLADGALVAMDCDEEKSNVAFCYKEVELNGQKEKLVFEFLNFKENGYPNSVKASINGHTIMQQDGLKIEERGSYDYQVFLNFKTIGDYIIFTHTNGETERSTTLYGFDKNGNIILKESEIAEDNMRIKDYTDFITYDNNSIKIYATRLNSSLYYKEKNICYASDKDIVEAYYTYTLKDGKFTKKQTEAITAKDYIKKNEITCANK